MFGYSQKTYLGVDFGTSSIKVVELGIENREPVLLNYGEISLAVLESMRVSDQGNYDAQITIFLRALLERIGSKTKEVYVAMPAFIGLIALVEFPQMSEKELKEAIQFEAHKYIPSPLEEVALSWEIVGEHEGVSQDDQGKVVKKLEVLLVAALNKEVDRYESYIQSVEYDMQLLELETFSMVRSTIRDTQDVYLLIDIGSRATNFVLVENRLVKMSRNLDVGGQDVTRTLMESLNISYERAETLKKSDKDFLNDRESRMTFLSLEMIASEVQRMLQARLAKNTNAAPVRGIILSGGTAAMTGLTEYFSHLLGLPVEVAQPWRGIRYDQSLQPAINRMGTSYSVAIGLALRGVETETKKDSGKKAFDVFWKVLKRRLSMKIG
ncbi:MAG: type IV pilus assembly protein PilM [Candidatus Moraniibacteriota bacterium]|nr:MAG: type IV pilus assembly protein PilM [Candidatus Moranbacteria bacterium]